MSLKNLQNCSDHWEVKKSPLNGGGVIQKALAGPLGWFPGAVKARETGAEEKQSNQLFARQSGILIHAGSRCLGQHSSQLLLSASQTTAGTGDGMSPAQSPRPASVPEKSREEGQGNQTKDACWNSMIQHGAEPGDPTGPQPPTPEKRREKPILPQPDNEAASL